MRLMRPMSEGGSGIFKIQQPINKPGEMRMIFFAKNTVHV